MPKAQPDGYHAVNPYVICKNAAEMIEFYKRAFNATELFRLNGPGDKVGHAEIRIGDSVVMLADEFPEMNAVSPLTLGGTTVGFCIYVADVDAAYAQALAAGAKADRPVQDQFYGDRSGTVIDPSGHKWTLATHIEDVSPEEMDRRMQELMKQPA